MAKVFGLQGYLTGKLGATVFAIRNGEQIGRQYNPVVSNPKTDAQVANRAKLKLLSQLSAAVAPVIAMPRQGMVSTRNLFTKHNYEYTTYGQNEASIPMGDILLTASYTAMSGLHVERSVSSISVNLMERADGQWDKVCYIILKKGDTGAIAPATSIVVSEAGVNGTFPGVLPYVEGDISVHCYGIRLNTQYSRVMFGNLTAPRAEDVAKIVTSRTFNESDMALSETRGVFLDSNESVAETSGISTVRINAIAYDRTSSAQNVGGTVTGGGNIEINTQTTLRAVAAADYTFIGWADSPNGEILSSSNEYQITATGARTIYACFRASNVTINLIAFDRNANAAGGGTVSGGGTIVYGSAASLTATPAEGKEFVGWAATSNGAILSTSNPYSIRATENRTLYAIFRTPVVQHTVTLNYATGSSATGGSMTGAGTYGSGDSVTVTANTAANYQFDGWYSDANKTNLVSSNASYTFTLNENTTLYAAFRSVGTDYD